MKYSFTYHKSLLFDILFDFKNRDTVLKAPIYQAFSSVSLLYLKPTTLKLGEYADDAQRCLTTIWNYTTLKLQECLWVQHPGLTTIWNYTTLKPQDLQIHIMPSLTTIWNYTTLKLAEYLLLTMKSLTTIWNYTTLKQQSVSNPRNTVWLPYEITLLSNTLLYYFAVSTVWLPYEITLLSNCTLQTL